jgi:hypothetical protein
MKDLNMDVVPPVGAARLHYSVQWDAFSGAGVDNALMAD